MTRPALPQAPVVIGDTEDTLPEDWDLGNVLRGESLCLACGAPFRASLENFMYCPVHATLERG
jgi:hypothetical protein